MLIRSLCDYYDIQSARGEAASDIMSEQPVHWMVMLTSDGRVADIIDKRIEESVPQKNGKVKIVKKPIVVSLPKRTQKTVKAMPFLQRIFFLSLTEKNVILTLFRTKTKRQLNTRKPKKPHNMSSVLPS